MTIHKYKMGVAIEAVIDIPIGATFLALSVQGHEIVMWWAFEPMAIQEYKEHYFVTLTTGVNYELPGILKHLGTYQIDGFVGHVFEQV